MCWAGLIVSFLLLSSDLQVVQLLKLLEVLVPTASRTALTCWDHVPPAETVSVDSRGVGETHRCAMSVLKHTASLCFPSSRMAWKKMGHASKYMRSQASSARASSARSCRLTEPSLHRSARPRCGSTYARNTALGTLSITADTWSPTGCAGLSWNPAAWWCDRQPWRVLLKLKPTPSLFRKAKWPTQAGQPVELVPSKECWQERSGL
jgi:hypothetical protein